MISPRTARGAARTGSLLIVIAGIIAMLATLAVTFLARMRQDAQESDLALHLAQCRLMLHAGMQFVQESSRLGYAKPGALGDWDNSVEAWGWIDIRNPRGGGDAFTPPAGALTVSGDRRYMIGPRDNNRQPLWTPGEWPDLGTVKRAPMFMVKRPPFAVVPHMFPNRIPDVFDPAVDPNYLNTFGIPLMKNPDPMPAMAPGIAPIPGSTTQRLEWEKGDLEPDMRSLGMAWFRVYREDGTELDRPPKAGAVGATFIITVGSGGTQGFRDWADVLAPDSSAPGGNAVLFGNDRGSFETLLAAEVRQWYRVEWSAAVGGGETLHFASLIDGKTIRRDHSYHARAPVNSSRSFNGDAYISTSEPRNYVGTISYIQRLASAPSRW